MTMIRKTKRGNRSLRVLSPPMEGTCTSLTKLKAFLKLELGIITPCKGRLTGKTQLFIIGKMVLLLMFKASFTSQHED